MAWDVDGIVGERRFVALLYNEPADTLIVCFERTATGGYPVGSIYTKRPRDSQYTRVFAADDVTTASYVVSASCAPLAFFYVNVARPMSTAKRGDAVGLNWSHIGRLDLATGVVEVAVDRQRFVDKHGGAWVADILAVGDDGGSLLCRIATARRVPVAEDPGSTAVGYSLCRLDLATCDFEVIAPLRNVFF